MKHQVKFRKGAMSLKDFYALKKEQKEEYVQELLKVPVDSRGDIDIYILRFFNKEELPNHNFFKIPTLSNGAQSLEDIGEFE